MMQPWEDSEGSVVITEWLLYSLQDFTMIHKT